MPNDTLCISIGQKKGSMTNPDQTEPQLETLSSRILVLPEDEKRKKQLRDKLNDYRKRRSEHMEKARYQPPETFALSAPIAMLESLLDNGFVNFSELEKSFEPTSFARYEEVITDYVLTGGQNTRSGTGFPPNR